MKRLFEFVLCLFYRYYDKGSTRVIAYESSLIAVSTLIFLNMFAILTLLFKADASWVLIIEQHFGKMAKLISGLFLILPQYFILRFFFKKEEIVSKTTLLKKNKQWNVFLISYIIISVIFLVFSIKMR